jgi:ferritin-like metal-binding protein YciE
MTMEMDHLQDLLLHDLRDLYNAENQLLKALPRMAKAASSPELKKAFELHTKETKAQVTRLEKVFKALGEKARGKKCHAMEGLIEEGKELMQEDVEPEVLDAGLIGAAQKVEHYEIAGYGTARTYAQLLGNEQAARLLQETLDEEGNTDKKLTALAESLINIEAAQGTNQ